MKPDTRKIYITTAFTPMDRVTDRRAEYHLRHFQALTQEQTEEKAYYPGSLLPLALSALLIWGAIAAAVWFLVHTWSA